MEKPDRIVIFANPNGENRNSLGFVKTFTPEDHVEFQVISLAERLAEYTKFPSANRKARLEEVLVNAANETARAMSQEITSQGLKCSDPEIVTGKFPESVEKWFETHNPDLLVKESLACDGEFGHASKGDLRLSRHVPLPVMLLNTSFNRDSSIMVAIPPIFEDKRGLARATKIISQGIYWAKFLNAEIHFVHAWELFGESVMRSRFSKEELDSSLIQAKENAQKEMNVAIEEARIPEGITFKLHLHKGDPTRVLLAELELLKPTLVVMGSVANEGVRGVLLGNTAETVTRRKLTNTLIVK